MPLITAAVHALSSWGVVLRLLLKQKSLAFGLTFPMVGVVSDIDLEVFGNRIVDNVAKKIVSSISSFASPWLNSFVDGGVGSDSIVV